MTSGAPIRSRRLVVKLTDEEYRKLCAAADASGRTVSAFVREAAQVARMLEGGKDKNANDSDYDN